jgi:hypothetical protein
MQSRDAGFLVEPNKTEPDFPFLHNIARHIIHSTETLEVSIRTVIEMIAKFERIEASDQISSLHRLDLHRQTLSNLRARSQALEARLRNEISLVSCKSLFVMAFADDILGLQHSSPSRQSDERGYQHIYATR